MIRCADDRPPGEHLVLMMIKYLDIAVRGQGLYPFTDSLRPLVAAAEADEGLRRRSTRFSG